MLKNSRCVNPFFQFILTAAHCVAWGREILNAKIVVGAHHLGVKDGLEVTEHRVRRVKYHIDYDKETTDQDSKQRKLEKKNN